MKKFKNRICLDVRRKGSIFLYGKFQFFENRQIYRIVNICFFSGEPWIGISNFLRHEVMVLLIEDLEKVGGK